MTASKDDGMREAREQAAYYRRVRKLPHASLSNFAEVIITLDDEIERLLSSSAAASGVVMKEALEKIAGHHGAVGVTYREQAHLMRETALAALSSSRSAGGREVATRADDGPTAPISTDTKGTTK